MSGHPSHFRPHSSRDGAGDSSQPRSSLPASLAQWIVAGPLPRAADDELPDQPVLPSPNYVPAHQLLPPLSTLSHSNQLQTTDGSSSTRHPLPPLQEGVRLDSDSYSTSNSPASADYDDAQHYPPAFRRHQDSFTNVRTDPTSVVPYPDVSQPRQPYESTSSRGLGIRRPSSALDTAYLSDLSTVSSSSLRGAPPPSHTSADTSTSMSSESSTARVRSWQRGQDQGEGHAMGTETDQFSPINREVEYERRHGRRTHFPVSTIRGGSTSNRGYSYTYGASSSSAGGISGRYWTAEEEEFGPNTSYLSNSEQEGEMESTAPTRRGRGRVIHGAFRGEYSGSEAVSSSTSPIPSQRSESVHSLGHDNNYADMQRQDHRYAYMTWSPQNRTLPERTIDPQRRASGFRLSPVRASGSSPGGNDAFYLPERYRNSQVTSYDPGVRDAHPGSATGPSSRAHGSSGYDPVRVRAEDITDPPRSLPYTSIPRYSAAPPIVSHRGVADDRRYVPEPVPAPFEGSYEAAPVTTTRRAHRGQTFPAATDTLAQLPEEISVGTARSPVHTFLRGPGCGTPPPPQDAVGTQRSPRIQSHRYEASAHTQQAPGRMYDLVPSTESPIISPSAPDLARGSNTPASSRDEGTLVSREPAIGTLTSSAPPSVAATEREMRAPRIGTNVQMQYTFPPEAQRPSRVSQQSVPSSSISSPSPTKRSRSKSPELTGTGPTTPGSTSNVPPGQYNPVEGSTSGRGKRGGQGRGRGRGRGKKALSSTFESESAPVEQVMFWGREQRLAHAARANTVPIVNVSTSTSASASASTQLVESSVRPQLLSTSRRTLPPLAAAEPTEVSRYLAKKEKGKGDDGMAKESQMAEARDYDEDTTDDEDRPEFSVGSAPSRSGSGSRAPKIKIEVACDFCRKRKMRCDGLRPTCRNCQRKNVECSYIAQVRRRGPGKKQKTVEARPKKTNRRIESGRKQTKVKGKAKAPKLVENSQEGDQPPLSPRTPSPQASGSGLREGAPTHHFVSGISPALNELYLPSPLQHMASPRVGRNSSLPRRAPASPFSSDALRLEPYTPEHMPFYGHNSPFGGELFLPGHSSTALSAGNTAEPPIDPSLRDSHHPSLASAAQPSAGTRAASIFSSGPSSSEDEAGRPSRRRRKAKRARTEGDDDEAELEDGEIDESGPSDAAYDYE